MDEENTVRRLALVLAVQAEIEGMKAHNAVCLTVNRYVQQDFAAQAEELRNLAYAHSQQLFG